MRTGTFALAAKAGKAGCGFSNLEVGRTAGKGSLHQGLGFLTPRCSASSIVSDGFFEVRRDEDWHLRVVTRLQRDEQRSGDDQ